MGEGFDYPRLDTLFLVLPISWKGLVAQYAGRLHRENEGKKDVRIYDYIDIHEPVCESMYRKRLKGYSAIGYRVLSKDIRHCLMTQKTCTHRHVKDRFSMVTHSVWHLCKICKVQDNLLSYPLQNSIVQNETHLLKHSESFMRVVFKYQFSHQRKTVRRII